MAQFRETQARRTTPQIAPGPIAGCPFCARSELEGVLTETANFYVAADHAPLVGGHTLIIPKAHYACYGIVPAVLESEFLALKEQLRRFLTATYRAPTFFEHGVFRQTVFHAHIHAIPLGPADLNLEAMATQSGGQRLRALAEVRAWYAERGQYFTLETPGDPEHGTLPQAAIFPPEMGVYGRALNALHSLTSAREGWAPPQLRHATRLPKIRALLQSWQDWNTQEVERA
jgi:diadenosine tetraphosphate (Ap4A) HIT family hydrolase